MAVRFVVKMMQYLVFVQIKYAKHILKKKKLRETEHMTILLPRWHLFDQIGYTH